jgi:serine protease Do
VVQTSATRPPAAPRKPAAHQDPQFREFFERFAQEKGEDRVRQGTPAPRSVGSGVILSADGYVLTAEHIVEGTDVITARLADGRTVAATLVGKDRRGGIALLKLAASGLQAAATGDPRKLRPGERVFALGGIPGGRAPAVTDGIVSALDVDENSAAGYLQTTAPLYPSMGGGPLFNLEGQVIGINSMLYSRVTNNGISFAVPIDDAMALVAELRAHGKVRRGTLGVNVQDVGAEAAAALGLPSPAGALIASVVDKSPAQQAGISTGDVVTRYQGEAVQSANHIIRLIAKAKPGDRVTLRVRRDKAVPERDIAVVLGEASN